MSWSLGLYNRLPVFLQNAACSIEGRKQRRLRHGGDFPGLLEQLEVSQWSSAAEIEACRREQLTRIVRHAYDTVPYYRDLFDRNRLRPDDIKGPDDLPKIPVMTKEDLRSGLGRMVSSDFDKSQLVSCHTSGTSGKCLSFYQEPRAVQFRWAVWWRHRRRFGVEYGEPYATFTGLPAVHLDQEQPPFWRENRAQRQTIFTMHHVVPAKVRAVVDRLNKGGFTYYAGYPSILFVLAGLIEEEGLEISAPPRMIFTGAENLYEHQRAVMQRVFKAPVTDQYGFSEGCGNASRCTQDVYHEDHEFGILECADEERLPDGRVRGKIVATGFASRAMPLIRYEVGDVGVWQDRVCGCGRKSRVLTNVEGRLEDFVVTPEGRRILRFDYIFKDAGNVRDAQVIQDQPGGIRLRVVRRPGYSSMDERQLRTEIAARVSSRLHVSFEYVDEIEREASGKIRAVKSSLGSTSRYQLRTAS